MRKHVLSIVCIAVLAVVLAACSSSTPEPAPAPAPADGTQVQQPGADEQPPPDTTAKVSIMDFAFQPDSLSIAAGVPTKLNNEGAVAHTFTIDGSPVDVEVQPGASESAPTDELDPGTYSFHCRFHSQMTGTLTVA